MRRFQGWAGLLLIPIAVACTQDGKVKESAETYLRDRRQSEYSAESASIPASLSHLKATYVRVLTEKTLIETDKIEISGETATVSVTVKAPSAEVRQALREIIQRLNPAKQEAFNVPDALNMIGGQIKDPLTTDHSTLKLRKKDRWQVVN